MFISNEGDLFPVATCYGVTDCGDKGTCENNRCNCNHGWETSSDCSGIC